MQLRAQVTELSTHLEGLERERDFYFAKVCRYVKLSFESATYAMFGLEASWHWNSGPTTNRGRRGCGERLWCAEGDPNNSILDWGGPLPVTRLLSGKCWRAIAGGIWGSWISASGRWGGNILIYTLSCLLSIALTSPSPTPLYHPYPL